MSQDDLRGLKHRLGLQVCEYRTRAHKNLQQTITERLTRKGPNQVHYDALSTCIQRHRISSIVYKTLPSVWFSLLPASSCRALPWRSPCTSRSPPPRAARAPPPPPGASWPPWPPGPWCQCLGVCARPGQARDVCGASVLSAPDIGSSLPLPDIAGTPGKGKILNFRRW